MNKTRETETRRDPTMKTTKARFMATGNLISRQYCSHTFEVSEGGERLPVYIYRDEIGGDFAYYVKAGDVMLGAKAETLAGGFDTCQAALAWIWKNVE
jgi:ribosomal protein S19